MSNGNLSDSIRCFAIIATTTAVICIIDLIVRAFFYEQAQFITLYLPSLIGNITILTMTFALKLKESSRTQDNEVKSDTRRVRVTGPVK